MPAKLGEFEQLVLLAILRIDEDAYAVSIRREIARCTDRRPALSAVYTTLGRLEEKGLVKSWFGDPTPERGGRAKRCFTVSRKGIREVARVQRSYAHLLEGLDLPGVAYAR